jgi:hypothetical protein
MPTATAVLIDIIRERERRGERERERKGVKWQAVRAFATCIGSQLAVKQTRLALSNAEVVSTCRRADGGPSAATFFVPLSASLGRKCTTLPSTVNLVPFCCTVIINPMFQIVSTESHSTDK